MTVRRALRIAKMVLFGVWWAFAGLVLLVMLILTFAPGQ